MKAPINTVTQPIITISLDFKEREKLHTNPTLMRMNNEWIMLYRDRMGPSNLLISTLNDNLEVKQTKIFDVSEVAKDYKWGAEDPRLFWHNDNLFFTYHGTKGNPGKQDDIRTIMGEVKPNLTPGYSHEIQYAPGFEKNWTFFSYAGQQYAVNSFAPKFKIVRIDAGTHNGEKFGYKFARDIYFNDEPAFFWPYGETRGGSPAYRIGESYYSVFQSHVIEGKMPRYYCAAFVKFSAKPPFKIEGITGPVLTPDEYRDWGYSVVFPAGLQLHKGKWYVSYGHMDNECRISIFDFAQIEALFVEPKRS